MPELLDEILSDPGSLEAEVESYYDDLRAFVVVLSFRKDQILGGKIRYAYFSHVDLLYRLMRYSVSKELCDGQHDISELELIDFQSIVVPDKRRLLMILEMWLPSIDCLKYPQCTDAPF